MLVFTVFSFKLTLQPALVLSRKTVGEISLFKEIYFCAVLVFHMQAIFVTGSISNMMHCKMIHFWEDNPECLNLLWVHFDSLVVVHTPMNQINELGKLPLGEGLATIRTGPLFNSGS